MKMILLAPASNELPAWVRPLFVRNGNQFRELLPDTTDPIPFGDAGLKFLDGAIARLTSVIEAHSRFIKLVSALLPPDQPQERIQTITLDSRALGDWDDTEPGWLILHKIGPFLTNMQRAAYKKFGVPVGEQYVYVFDQDTMMRLEAADRELNVLPVLEQQHRLVVLRWDEGGVLTLGPRLVKETR